MTRDGRRARLRRSLVRWGFVQLTHFVWDRGQVGFRQNPDGMRAVVRAGFVMTGLAWAVDAALIRFLDLGHGGVLLLVQAVWISAALGWILLHIGFLSSLEGHPSHDLGAANWITLGRLCALPTFAFLILRERWAAAGIAYLALAVSDVADGVIARRRQQETRLGFVLDPTTDVLFQIVVFACLFDRGRIEAVTLAAVLVRYGLLMAGCLALYLIRGRIWIKPTPFGRASGAVLGAATLLLLGEEAAGSFPLRPILLDRAIALISLVGALHVLVIGWVNFRRPAQAGYGDWGRWGLRLARDDRADHERRHA